MIFCDEDTWLSKFLQNIVSKKFLEVEFPPMKFGTGSAHWGIIRCFILSMLSI